MPTGNIHQARTRLLRPGLVDNGSEKPPVTCQYASTVDGMPSRHEEPFDRLLIAQAMMEGMTHLTSDLGVARYPGPIRLV